jgi:hypothetical protein
MHCQAIPSNLANLDGVKQAPIDSMDFWRPRAVMRANRPRAISLAETTFCSQRTNRGRYFWRANALKNYCPDLGRMILLE